MIRRLLSASAVAVGLAFGGAVYADGDDCPPGTHWDSTKQRCEADGGSGDGDSEGGDLGEGASDKTPGSLSNRGSSGGHTHHCDPEGGCGEEPLISIRITWG